MPSRIEDSLRKNGRVVKSTASYTKKAKEEVSGSLINYKKFGDSFKCALQPLVDAVISALPDDLHVVNATSNVDASTQTFEIILELNNGTMWTIDLSALYDNLNQQLNTDTGETYIQITDGEGNVVNQVDVCPLVEQCLINNGLPSGIAAFGITDGVTTETIDVGDTITYTSSDGSAVVTVSATDTVDITIPKAPLPTEWAEDVGFGSSYTYATLPAPRNYTVAGLSQHDKYESADYSWTPPAPPYALPIGCKWKVDVILRGQVIVEEQNGPLGRVLEAYNGSVGFANNYYEGLLVDLGIGESKGRAELFTSIDATDSLLSRAFVYVPDGVIPINQVGGGLEMSFVLQYRFVPIAI